MFKHILLAGLAVVALGLGADANATTPLLQMKLTSGAATSGVLTESAGGVVSYSGGLGNFTLNVTSGFGATAGLGQSIDLSSFNATAAAAGTLTMMLTETNLTGALNPTTFLSNVSGQLGINATTLTTLGYTTYIDSSNAAFATTTLVGPTQNFSAPSSPAPVSGGVSFATVPSGGITGIASTGPLFSETLVVTLTTNGSSRTSLDATMGPRGSVSVLEPASMLTLGLGAAVLGMARRRARRC